MPTARQGDAVVGICCCHSNPPCIGTSGIIVSGAGTVYDENSSNARCGDSVISACGHPGVVVSCSSTVYTENPGQARVGDSVVGCIIGTIVSGASITDNL